jgi:hypothetical protein
VTVIDQSAVRELRTTGSRHTIGFLLQTGAGAARLKIENYYRKVDDSAAYYAASVLNPGFKGSWFEDRWSEDPAT